MALSCMESEILKLTCQLAANVTWNAFELDLEYNKTTDMLG